MRMAELVARYHDLPLGSVDASVIAAAERRGVKEIATLDRRHFAVVRPNHTTALALASPVSGVDFVGAAGAMRVACPSIESSNVSAETPPQAGRKSTARRSKGERVRCNLGDTPGIPGISGAPDASTVATSPSMLTARSATPPSQS